MPKYRIEKGQYPDDFLDYIQDNEKGIILIDAEVQGPRKRLRGAFHVVLENWFNSGCYSCTWNDQYIRTIGGLKNYYKFHACEGKAKYYMFGGEMSKDKEFFINNLPEKYHRLIIPVTRGWEEMTKKQQCAAINLMVTEIKQAHEIPEYVEKSLNLLEKDSEALISVGYYNYLKKHGKR